MKSKQTRIKIGDKIKCSCCDEVKGVVTKIYENETVNWQPKPFSGYGVKNDPDICSGAEVVCEKEKAIKI